MRKYEKTILKISDLFYPEKKVSKIHYLVAENPHNVVEWPFNKRKPYRGDYYPEFETSH